MECIGLYIYEAILSAVRTASLLVWYDWIDLESVVERLTREAAKTDSQSRRRERLERARQRNIVEDDFPKLVEHQGAAPVIKDNPPPDIPSRQRTSPRVSDELH